MRNLAQRTAYFGVNALTLEGAVPLDKVPELGKIGIVSGAAAGIFTYDAGIGKNLPKIRPVMVSVLPGS